MNKIFTLLITVILIDTAHLTGFAQSGQTTPKVIPLSPNAAEFAKYGNIPVSGATGTPDISLPIYEINTGKIRVPITLSYHASGIQVNQKATWVGLGWSLNAGGTISRSVRGLPDEATNGWLNKQGTTQAIANSTSKPELYSYAADADDSSPDFFTYGMPGGSGRFIYSQTTSSFQTIPSEPIKVQRQTGGGANDNTYQITDRDGTNYYYQDKQTYFNDGNGALITNRYTQSWYLSSIVSADTKDTVSFSYQLSTTQGGTNEEVGETEIGTYSTGADNNQYQSNGSSISQSVFYHSYVALKEISFRQGKVTFYSNTPRRDYAGGMLDSITVYSKSANNSFFAISRFSFNHDYFTTSQPTSDQFDYRLRLLSMSKLPAVPNGQTETHQFFYDGTPLPSINSHAVDYWGFYNGASPYNGLLPNVLPEAPELYAFKSSNQTIGNGDRNESDNFIKAGILQKIVYPTGGYTAFTYEPHQYTSDQQNTNTVAVANASLQGIGKNHPTSSTTNITWPNDAISNVGSMTIYFSAHNNPNAYDVAQQVTLTDVTTGSNIGVWEHSGDFTRPYTVTASAAFDPSHSYRLRLVVDDNAPTNVSFTLTAQKNSSSTQLKKGGGLRIAAIQNYGNNNALLSTERYTYNAVYIGKNDAGIANNYTKVTTLDYSVCNTSPCFQCHPDTYITISYYGTPSYSGQNFEGANVLYGDVRKTAYDGNGNANGQTVYTYNTSRSFSSIFNPSMPGGREYIDNNLGRTSMPESVAYYSANPDGTFKAIKAKQYSYAGMGSGFQENLLKVYANYVTIPQGVDCGSSYQQFFTKYDYNIAVAGLKLSQVVENDYNNNNVVSKVTQYNYDNPAHMEVTRVTTTGSDGKTTVMQNKYPADYTDNTYGSDLLRNQSINNSLLEQSITTGNTFVSKTATSYSNFQGSVLPEYSIKAMTNGTSENRARYNQYDAEGNLLELSRLANNSEQKTVYLWGYNRQYPIAKIDNASYQDVVNVLSQGTIDQLAVSTPSDPTQVRALLSPLRTDNRLKNALVTTYTYSPLVGMTSETDAKGMTTTFEYDSFQRLLNVRDLNGDIVKHNDYHYQQ